MCGICGIYARPAGCADPALVARMTALLRHRGPDDEGVFQGGEVVLGAVRLAVIDITPAAHQPISNEDGTAWIVYNGEVYNHLDLRRHLEPKGYRYRSASDGESVLHAYEEYGEQCLERLRGIYAFAVWDARDRKLFLAVDRVGVKPLYYTVVNGTFVFGSELKAILQHPAVSRAVDPQALDEYLRYGYVPAPRTIFRGISRLPGGHCLSVEDGKIEVRRYWDLRFAPDRTRKEADWADEALELLRESVRMQLISDVPLGVLLSGGVDSSAIVALTSQSTDRPVATFSVGFNVPGAEYGRYDELAYARMVAERFGTDHHEFVSMPTVHDILPEMIWHFDEPFANVTAIPMYHICRMAREFVTVALAGVGGDEVFGGYPRYAAARLLPSYHRLPRALREGILSRLAAALPDRPSEYALENRIKKFVLSAADGPEATYRNWMSLFADGTRREIRSGFEEAAGDGAGGSGIGEAYAMEAGGSDLLNRIAYADIMTYLPDNLLTYADRMSMAHSLEIRVPFCDHKLMEFAAQIPPDVRIKGARLKSVLKRALEGILPAPILERRKQGFSVPLGHWLKGELLPLARQVLGRERIGRSGFWNPGAVELMLTDHLSGKANHAGRLWALIVFEVWHRMYFEGTGMAGPRLSLRDLEESA